MDGEKSYRDPFTRNQTKKTRRNSFWIFPLRIKEAKLKAKDKKLDFRLMFQDEARFGRINEPRACWAPKGIRPISVKQIIREYTYAYGAISPKDGVFDSLILPTMDSCTMSIFLREVSKRHPKDYILMVMDGASCHSSGKLRLPKNMKIVNTLWVFGDTTGRQIKCHYNSNNLS